MHSNRRRPREVVEEADPPQRPSSIIFIAKGVFFRSDTDDSRLSNRILEEEFLLPSFRTCSIPSRTNEGRGGEGGREEEWRVVSIQMRKFRIYTARQAIISAGRFFARTFYRDRTNRGA